MASEVVYAQSKPEDALAVATAISGLLSDNGVTPGDGIAGLMIVLLSATRPDLAKMPNSVGDFIRDISVAIAKWEPPTTLEGEVIPEVPGGLSNAN